MPETGSLAGRADGSLAARTATLAERVFVPAGEPARNVGSALATQIGGDGALLWNPRIASCGAGANWRKRRCASGRRGL